MEKETLIIAFSDVGAAKATRAALPELAKHYRLQVFAKDNLAYKTLDGFFNEAEKKAYGIVPYKQMPIIEAYKIIRSLRPAAVITGLSNAHKKLKNQDGLLEQQYKADFSFADAAARLGVLSIGISEAPYLSAYMIRQRMNLSRRGPEVMITASQKMQKFFADTGLVEKGRAYLLPMPHYKEAIDIKTAPQLPAWQRKLAELNRLRDDDRLVLYTSSCSPKADLAAVRVLGELVQERPELKVLMAFHPKDSEEQRQKMLKAVPGAAEINKGGLDSLPVFTALGQRKGCQIAGLRTVLLFETVLTGCNVVSINAGNDKSMRSPTAELGLAPEVHNVQELAAVLQATDDGRLPAGMKPVPEIYTRSDAPEQFAKGVMKIIRLENLRKHRQCTMVPQKTR